MEGHIFGTLQKGIVDFKTFGKLHQAGGGVTNRTKSKANIVAVEGGRQNKAGTPHYLLWLNFTSNAAWRAVRARLGDLLSCASSPSFNGASSGGLSMARRMTAGSTRPKQSVASA